jgi:hypothetical protein
MFMITFVSLLFFLVNTILVTLTFLFGFSCIPFLLIPTIVTFLVFFRIKYSSLFLVILLGFIMDGLFNFYFGTNAVILIILWLLSILAVGWIGRPRWLILYIFAYLFSFTYRLFLHLFAFINNHYANNISFMGTIFLPTLDSLLGVSLLFLLSGYLGLRKEME